MRIPVNLLSYSYDQTSPDRNDWHYAEVTWNESAKAFNWRNRDGFQWSLKPISMGNGKWDTTKLKVGPECPYSYDNYPDNGYKFAVVTWKGEPGHSKVNRIRWDGESRRGEEYLREESCGPVNPFKTGTFVPPPPWSSPTKSG